MDKRTLVALVVSMLATAPSALPAQSVATVNNPADVAAVNAVEDQLANTFAIDAVMKFYAPDAVVIDGFYPGLYHGAKEIRAGFAPQFATVKAMKPQILEMNVLTDGRMACAMSMQRLTVTNAEGKQNNISFRLQDVLRKIDGKWLITQQHLSYPLDARTGAGVLDGPLVPRGPIAWSGNVLAGPAISPDQAMAEIRAWERAQLDTQRAEQSMKFYGPGDDVSVYDSIYPGIYRGMRETYQGWLPQMQFKAIDVKFRELATDSDGLLGASYSIQDIVIDQPDGSKQKINMLRQSDCLHKVDGKWYTLHEVVSFPIDVRTGKGVTFDPAVPMTAR